MIHEIKKVVLVFAALAVGSLSSAKITSAQALFPTCKTPTEQSNCLVKDSAGKSIQANCKDGRTIKIDASTPELNATNDCLSNTQSASSTGSAEPTVIPPNYDDAAKKWGCKDPSGPYDQNFKVDESNCGIIYYLNLAFNILSGIVVLAIVGNIAYSGVMYSMAQGDSGATKKAKARIQQGLIAFLLYFMLYGFLQWLIPGGAF